MNLPRLKTPLDDWIANASPGDRVIVQTSRQTGNAEVSHARGQGWITTAIERAGPKAFNLIAIRCKVKKRDVPIGSRGNARSWNIGMTHTGPTRAEQAARLVEEGMGRAEIALALGVRPKTASEYLRQAKQEGLL
jgi:DNA-binding NarL/FixJ family response regulator